MLASFFGVTCVPYAATYLLVTNYVVDFLWLTDHCVPLGMFQPAVSSPSKKQAKAQAATAHLPGLGFSIDSPIAYTAS